MIFKPLEVRAQKNRKVSRPVRWGGLRFVVRVGGLLKIREDHRQARRDGLLGQGCVSFLRMQRAHHFLIDAN